MSIVNKYMVYVAVNTLRRLPEKLFEQFEPKYLYKYEASESGDQIYVAVFEQYEKQINATSTLTCVMECTNTYNRVEMKKSGGRMGFRGSSLSVERRDRKSTRLNSSHVASAYAAFCSEQKKTDIVGTA